MLWAEIYHTADTAKKKLKDPALVIRSLLPVFYTIVTFLTIVIVSLFLVDWIFFSAVHKTVSQHTNEAEMTLIVFTAGLYIVTSLAFLFYGIKFLVELKRSGNSMFTVKSRRQRIVLEVQIITAVFSVLFLCRGVLTLLQIFLDVVLSEYWYGKQ